MLHGYSWRIVALVAACGVVPCAAAPRSQSQDSQTQQTQSVADAAKRAREEKKAAAKPTKVITDDDLDKVPKPGAEGLTVSATPKLETQPPNPADVSKVEAADIAAVTVDQAAKKAGYSPQIADLKEQVAQAKKELDLLLRELALDQDTYYSNVDYAHDTTGQAKLATEQQEINDKKIDLEGLKARLAELLEAENSKKKAAGEEPTPASPAETQTQPQPQP